MPKFNMKSGKAADLAKKLLIGAGAGAAGVAAGKKLDEGDDFTVNGLQTPAGRLVITGRHGDMRELEEAIKSKDPNKIREASKKILVVGGAGAPSPFEKSAASTSADAGAALNSSRRLRDRFVRAIEKLARPRAGSVSTINPLGSGDLPPPPPPPKIPGYGPQLEIPGFSTRSRSDLGGTSSIKPNKPPRINAPTQAPPVSTASTQGARGIRAIRDTRAGNMARMGVEPATTRQPNLINRVVNRVRKPKPATGSGLLVDVHGNPIGKPPTEPPANNALQTPAGKTTSVPSAGGPVNSGQPQSTTLLDSHGRPVTQAPEAPKARVGVQAGSNPTPNPSQAAVESATTPRVYSGHGEPIVIDRGVGMSTGVKPVTPSTRTSNIAEKHFEKILAKESRGPGIGEKVKSWLTPTKYDNRLLKEINSGSRLSLEEVLGLPVRERANYLAHVKKATTDAQKLMEQYAKAGKLTPEIQKNLGLESLKMYQESLLNQVLPTIANTTGAEQTAGAFRSRYMQRRASLHGVAPHQYRSALPKEMLAKYEALETASHRLVPEFGSGLAERIGRANNAVIPELTEAGNKFLLEYGKGVGKIEDTLANLAETMGPERVDANRLRELHYAMIDNPNASLANIKTIPAELRDTAKAIRKTPYEKTFTGAVERHRGLVGDLHKDAAALGKRYGKTAEEAGKIGREAQAVLDDTLRQYRAYAKDMGALDLEAAKNYAPQAEKRIVYEASAAPQTAGEIRQQARGARAEQRAAQQAARETAEGAGRQVAQEAAEGAGRQVAEQAGKKAVEEAAEQAGKKALTSEAAEKGLLKWMGEHPKSLMVGGGLLGGLYLLSKFLTGGSSGGPVYPQQGAYGPY